MSAEASVDCTKLNPKDFLIAPATINDSCEDNSTDDVCVGEESNEANIDSGITELLNKTLRANDFHDDNDDGEEEVNRRSSRTTSWVLKGNHSRSIEQFGPVDVLIMSEAGKPIYCYSDREDVTTLMGVCVALVNFVFKTQNDHLKSINLSNGLQINFSVRPPLIIVVVCRRNSCFDEQTLINQIHAQIVTTMTLKSLKHVFQQAPTYDLKRVIHSNEFRTMNILVKAITTPIADHFSTFQNRRLRNCSLFNNVVSFYTSQKITAPRTTTLNHVVNNGTSVTSNSLVVVHDHKPNVLSRVYIPIAIIPSVFRDQITSLITTTVASFNDIVFSILFQVDVDEEYVDETVTVDQPSLYHSNTISSSDDEFIDAFDEFPRGGGGDGEIQPDPTQTNYVDIKLKNTKKNFKLVSVCNHTSKFRINPLDIQLIYSFIKASDSQLSTTESLWLPLCLSRIDANRFLFAHISYLSKKYCLVLLSAERNDFEKCRLVKETIQFKIDQMKGPETENIRSAISEIGQPNLQYIVHQTIHNCIMWQASTQTEFSSLNYYLIERMQRSSLKTLWIRSTKHQCALLGWHTGTFQLYAQFDVCVAKRTALNTVKTFITWLKKEEDKLIIKDS